CGQFRSSAPRQEREASGVLKTQDLPAIDIAS
ncbi:unnamed protein product, partial [Allacma fusca]